LIFNEKTGDYKHDVNRHYHLDFRHVPFASDRARRLISGMFAAIKQTNKRYNNKLGATV